MSARVVLGDCRALMAAMDADGVDAVVCDPPYGLSFMGKGWDRGVPGDEFWLAALRVAKPGAHLVAFGGTRTHHRLMCAIEDAGWEIRDCLMWLYGSGFPKSHDVSKAIDRAAGIEREDKFEGHFKRNAGPTGNKKCDACGKWLVSGSPCKCPRPQDAAQTDAAREWDGWGTALKPAWEPIILARKPLSGTVAANVLAHGTGALNIDGCRIGTESTRRPDNAQPFSKGGIRDDNGRAALNRSASGSESGRWPANVVLDEAAAALLDADSGERPAGVASGRSRGFGNEYVGATTPSGYNGEPQGYGDTGGASRFFYTAKASRSEREHGLEGMERKRVVHQAQTLNNGNGDLRNGDGLPTATANIHPTVKPVELMRWLVRLVTPPRGLVLDPFAGSGSTGVACIAEGFAFEGHELEPEHVAISNARLDAAQPSLFA